MQLHQLKKNSTFKDEKRVGRGGKKGTYCGKGGKGQKGRAGAKFKPIIRGWIKGYPKLRGYNFNTRSDVSVLNLSDLEKGFQSKEIVTPASLILKRIIRRVDGKAPSVKILANGDITKSFFIDGCVVSAKAKEKIEKAGGSVKEKEVKKIEKKTSKTIKK
ncbi:MAG: uL15 family ribosomal protein [Candidatus Paceibacterota bacterium]|jgi:large subunit ribosomal protein L15|nr:uL15 family ribosomal protein [bacterium]